MASFEAEFNRVFPYQLSMIVYCTIMALTGNRGFGTDSGDKALEIALRTMVSSSYENCPMDIVRGSDGKYCAVTLLSRCLE